MKTKNESVSGKVGIWAVPTSSYDREFHKAPAFQYKFYANATKPWENGCVLVVEHDVILPVPEGINLIEKAIDTLQAAKTEVWADAQEKVDALDTKIKEFQLLTYQPEVDDVDSGAL